MEHSEFGPHGAMNEPDARSDSGDRLFSIDLHEIWAAIYRSRIGIITIFVACVILALAITMLTTPIYRAIATVQIDQEATKVLGTEEDNPSNVGAMDIQRFLNTQISVLKSRTVSTLVANELRLFNNPAFLRSMGIDPEMSPPANLSPAEANRQLVLTVLDRNMSVSLPRDSRLASIQFNSPDAGLAARVANSYADNFIRNNLQRKFDTSRYAREFLRGQLEQAQARLEKSERAVVAFSTETKIIDPSSAAGDTAVPKSLLTASLVQLNQDYSTAVSRRISAQQQWERARRTPLMNLPEVLTNSAIQQLVQERAKLQSEYEEQLSRRKADYPLVQQAKAKVDEISSQVLILARGILGSIQNQYRVALDQEAAIGGKLDQLKQETLGEQRQGIQLSILKREADTNRQQFEALLRRYNQLNAESGVQTNNISVIDRAVTPTQPAWPKVPLNLALAMLAAIVLSAAYVFAREQLFAKIRKPEDVTQRLGLPLLGAIPDVSENVLDRLRDPKDQVSEAFNSVRTALSLSSQNGLPRTMAFVSTQKGEGKSTACYAAATGFGKLGKRVVILDLDLRLPTQHKIFGLENLKGMSDVLANNASPGDIIQATRNPNVSLISSGPIPPSPTELLTSDRLAQVLEQLLEQFDVVLIDSPPVLGLADAVVIGSLVEAIVFVVRSGTSNPKSVTTALRRLRQGHAHIAGVILSRFDPGRAGYGQSYNYTYQY